jgi:demethylmenaquinone methyltransferase/2-methoxy-6-polyprenyl-1,4-benzoquinol methylase
MMKILSVPGLSAKKSFIRRMFDDISGSYDLLNRVISFGLDGVWRRQTVKPHAGDKLVLDICSGTGDMALELRRQPGFGGLIVLGDFSPRMHNLARRKCADLDNVAFVYCDAEKMPFREGSFDGLICGYSLRNLGDLRSFGEEIRRVLQNGGRASIIDVAHPPGKPFAWLFYLYFYKLVPSVSKLFTRKKYAYKYLPVSLRTFLKQDEVLAALKSSHLDGEYRNVFKGAVAIYRLRK